MLNMQNVKDIKITEGDVRTIHDKDNRLIWGRLAYDTKYEGDTYQQTYSGKNLFNPVAMSNAWYTLESDGAISTGAGYTVEGRRYFNSIALKAGTYTLSFIPTTEAPQGLRYSIRDMDTSTDIVNENRNFVNGKRQAYTFTLTQDYQNIGICLVMARRTEDGQRMYLYNIQLESGSTATAYEPYVGGIPAPNPDYPQDIDVVTGEQTVTIGDGVDSEDFTISLGATELCKIGDYQDYIYKSGDDWYVHKATQKEIYDGVGESWQLSTSDITMRIALNPAPVRGSATNNPIIANQYVSRFSVSINNSIFISGGADLLGIKDNVNATSYQDWGAWLASNNLIVYYAIATPTDTKITDATLVGQLNAVHEWLTRYGYSSNVTGNLPIIIDRTNL